MITPRMWRTLRYCLILLLVLVPVYYLVYTTFWSEVSGREALQTSVLYAVVNMIFLGALHYVYASKTEEREEK